MKKSKSTSKESIVRPKNIESSLENNQIETILPYNDSDLIKIIND